MVESQDIKIWDVHHYTLHCVLQWQSGNVSYYETGIVPWVPKHKCEAERYGAEHFSFAEIPQCPCSTLCWTGSAMSPLQRTTDRPSVGLFRSETLTQSRVIKLYPYFNRPSSFTLDTLLGEICQINCFPWKLWVVVQIGSTCQQSRNPEVYERFGEGWFILCMVSFFHPSSARETYASKWRYSPLQT